MTRRLGTIALLAVLSFSTGLRAQESASSGIVGQVVDTTKGAMPGATYINCAHTSTQCSLGRKPSESTIRV